MPDCIAFIGKDDHGGFYMRHDDRPGHFRSWCVCECGWASPDIIGREGAIVVWERHVKETKARLDTARL